MLTAFDRLRRGAWKATIGICRWNADRSRHKLLFAKRDSDSTQPDGLPMRRIIALLFALTVSNAAAEDGTNAFKSPTVGFSVVKPSDWQFMTAEQNLENLARTQLNDRQLQEAMRKYSTAPLVAMTKYPEPFDDLNPSFKVNIRSLGELSGDDPVSIIKLAIRPIAKSFKDFTIAEQPSETSVSGLKAAHVRIHYSLEVPDGRTFPTASDLWIVPRGKFFFMIGAGTRQDEKTGTRAEIEKILSSVLIEGK